MPQPITPQGLEKHIGDTVIIESKGRSSLNRNPVSLVSQAGQSKIRGRLSCNSPHGFCVWYFRDWFNGVEGGSSEVGDFLKEGEIIGIVQRPHYINGKGYENKKEEVDYCKVQLKE